MLDGGNIGPALMVAGDEIPVFVTQALSAADIPFDVVKHVSQHIVEANPDPCDAVQHNGAAFANRRGRDQQLDHGKHHQDRE